MRVFTDGHDRVMFEETPEMMESASFHDQSPQYAPTSPASSAGMNLMMMMRWDRQPEVSSDSPPPPSRRRLRPLSSPAEEPGSSSPGSERSPATKAASTDDQEVLNQVNGLKKEVGEAPKKEDQRMLMMVIKGVDLSEVYSPSRFAAMAQRLGFVAGTSMDMKIEWDFSEDVHRRLAIETVRREKP